jgi:hypothetical protein
MPATKATKCTKLDNNLKPQVLKDGKDADRTLSRFQALLLDTVGPLASMLELKKAGRLMPELAADAATQALRFLGNPHANISVERRKRLASYLNSQLFRQGRPHTHSHTARGGGSFRGGSRGRKGRYCPYNGKENHQPRCQDGNRPNQDKCRRVGVQGKQPSPCLYTLVYL